MKKSGFSRNKTGDRHYLLGAHPTARPNYSMKSTEGKPQCFPSTKFGVQPSQ